MLQIFENHMFMYTIMLCIVCRMSWYKNMVYFLGKFPGKHRRKIAFPCAHIYTHVHILFGWKCHFPGKSTPLEVECTFPPKFYTTRKTKSLATIGRNLFPDIRFPSQDFRDVSWKTTQITDKRLKMSERWP